MADDVTAKVKVGGKTYELQLRDYSALEARAFREAVGMGLGKAFTDGINEPDILAGLIWIVRRRGDRRLTYEQVAEELTVGDVIDNLTDDDTDDEGDEGDADPET